MRAFAALLLSLQIPHSFAALVDLTAANRRPRLSGLPDWSEVGYERGTKPLPDNSQVGKILTSDQLAATYGIIPNDDQDDTDGLQRAIIDNPGSEGAFTLIQLPAGVINLSHTTYLCSNYLILRGAGNDPNSGTVLQFRPDENTKYDALTKPNGNNWDLEEMSFSWSYEEPGDTSSGVKHVSGSASSGWLWPGRSIFRVGSMGIADKFKKPASLAPANRVDIFYGTVNYHWRNDTKVKGFMADQTKEIAGYAGSSKVYVDTQNSSWSAAPGRDIWIGVPVRSYDYSSWQVQDQSYFQNEFMFQDWFTSTGSGSDEDGDYILLDHPLMFNVYTSSITGGSPQMQDETVYAKVMPIDKPAHHIGIEDLYMTQPMPGMDPVDAVHNYGNLAPESAMHGIVFRYARDCWVRNIQTYMTGSHPIATEAARYIQIQDNVFDGSWNKGAGGNGYLRGSRVWDSLYYNNTLRNLRHFTFQWCAMRNVATMQNMTNDINMHGGYEGHNLLELNYVSVPYSHRSGSCTVHCGGEGGSSEGGTWAPIYWSTGNKASKWSGASGPQNIFYRNYMLKEFSPNAGQEEYQPYFARDGSLSPIIWQFGQDRLTPAGTRYQHLSSDGGSTLLFDWQGHEQDHFHEEPAVGVNGELTDVHTSLFFRDVSNGTDVASYSSIAGYAYCLGKIPPKVVGYYLGSAETRSCLPWDPSAIDTTTYTHIIYAYASLASDGTVSLTSSQQTQVRNIVALKSTSPNLKVFIGVGGWGLGADGTNLITIATSSSGRTKFGTTALALVKQLGADGLDLEWTPCINSKCISATQFSTIVTALKSGLGTYYVSLSTPNDFWALSGVNTVTTNLAQKAEFISVFTHQQTSLDTDANHPDIIQATLAKAQKAGMPPTKLLMGVPFYSRPLGHSSLSSSCISTTELGQGTFPFYSVDSIKNHYIYDQDGYEDISSDDYFINSIVMSDGSAMFSDTPYSVSARALLSQNLCMGGLSVFSIDQDNLISDMTNAIFAPGGLLPTADEIVASLPVESLDSTGYLRDGAFDDFVSQIVSQYSFLTATNMFRVLLFGALRIQSDIANRLGLFLTESELSIDNFNVYKTWEAKASDYQLANATGTASNYWHCEGDGRSISRCPGSIIEHAGIVGSPHLTQYNTVEWFLDDYDGFKHHLNDSLGLNLDDLITGSFYVSRPIDSCSHQLPPTGPGQAGAMPSKTAEAFTPHYNARSHYSKASIEQDPHGRRRRTSHRGLGQRLANTTHGSLTTPTQTPVHRRAEVEDPYDPPENCRTQWTGLKLINPDTFFSSPVDIIKSFIASTDNAVSIHRTVANIPDVNYVTLMGSLESTLTSIALGNQTIANTVAYIQEVHYDQQLQEAFDEAHARESALSIIANIALGLLGFVPGIGGIADVVLGGVNTFSKISKFMDIASLAQTLRKDTSVFRLLGGGLRTEKDIVAAASSVEKALGAKSLATRGKLGLSVSKSQETLLNCIADDLGDFVLSAADFGNSFIIPDAATLSKRHLSLPAMTDLATDRHIQSREGEVRHIIARGSFKKDCIFNVKSSGELKTKDYENFCKASNVNMEVPTNIEKGITTMETYEECRTNRGKGRCQCDHIVEANEVRLFWSETKPGIQDKEKRAWCNLIANSKGSVMDIINSADNLAGLYGERKVNEKTKKSFNPNSLKENLLSMTKLTAEVKLKETYGEYHDDTGGTPQKSPLAYQITERYLRNNVDRRHNTGDKLDVLFQGWFKQIRDAPDSNDKTNALSAMKKFYDPTPANAGDSPRSIFRDRLAANEAKAFRTVYYLEHNDFPPETPNSPPNSPTDPDADPDADPRAQSKRPRSPEQDACGSDRGKRIRGG